MYYVKLALHFAFVRISRTLSDGVPPWAVRLLATGCDCWGLWYQIGAPWDAALLRFGALFARLEIFLKKGVDTVHHV